MTCSSMPGPGAPCARPAICPALSGLSRRSMNSPKSLASIPFALRDRIDPSPVRREERRIGAERIGWHRRHAPGADPGPVKRGIGMAQSLWGANVQTQFGLRGARHARRRRSRCFRACRISARASAPCSRRPSPRCSACVPEDITVRIGDTDFPAGPPSYGSRTTASITPPARTAAWRVLQTVIPRGGLVSERRRGGSRRARWAHSGPR